jgi:hypothetical protein
MSCDILRVGIIAARTDVSAGGSRRPAAYFILRSPGGDHGNLPNRGAWISGYLLLFDPFAAPDFHWRMRAVIKSAQVLGIALKP